ncbi:MAG: PSD1 and planctomycete cytochrome C domain-containing protein, partial [Planctomycetota bacterium]
MLRLSLLIGMTTVLLPSAIATADDAAPLRFNRDVRALLTDRCFACHGNDSETVEGGLRLDIRDEAIDAGAIVPGDSAESEMVARMLSADEDTVMPPPHTHKPLSPQEIKLLRRWIDEGAPYEAHWAYAPMVGIHQDKYTADGDATQRPTFSSIASAIDQSIDRRVNESGLVASESADRVTLIRRLHLDLTGIPPTPNQVDAFLQDDSPDAYDRLVDSLLDSPRYGERMAIYWLDLVRYADSVGYHGDQSVSQYPYRDYVISTFNNNLPYDQFIREQLAGDLLPNATLQQRVASGYNRLNQTTEEGGAQAKEYLAIYFADRVRNVSQVFMGATVGCAQCHDHKYDPYTIRDFYSLGAFFADLDERGVYGARKRPPMIPVPDAETTHRLEALDQKTAELKQQLESRRGTLPADQPQWEETLVGELAHNKITPSDVAWLDLGRRPDQGRVSGEWNLQSGPASQRSQGRATRLQSSAALVQHYVDDAPKTLPVTDETRFYAWIRMDEKEPPKSVMLQLNVRNSWEHRAVFGDDSIVYGRGKSRPAYFRAGELPAAGTWQQLVFTAKDLGLKSGDNVDGVAFTQFGGRVLWDDMGTISSDAPSSEIVAALHTPAEQRNDAQRQSLQEYYLNRHPELISINQQIQNSRNAYKTLTDSIPQTVVSQSVKPRTIRVLPRGNWMDDSGEIVQPAIPAFLGKLDTGERRATRLDFANWLCESNNPLTSRTMVNRVWSLLFGRGICTSVDDFGGQGTYPSYPELLDQLSIDFVGSGWDIKHLIRGIVHSRAYKRSSLPQEQTRTADPYNDNFARQGRFRIDAEMVRDAALSISGLLVEKIGGPSNRPYQPEGYYAQLNFPRRVYKADKGADQYRRGVYTHWQRTFLHPMLKAFDAPSREECTARRARSNTPVQALTMLNDPTFVEAAAALA